MIKKRNKKPSRITSPQQAIEHEQKQLVKRKRTQVVHPDIHKEGRSFAVTLSGKIRLMRELVVQLEKTIHMRKVTKETNVLVRTMRDAMDTYLEHVHQSTP